MVQIYEDIETKKLIEQLRKEDPSINLSDIFKISLQRYKEDRFGEEQDRLVKLSKMLEKARFEEQQIIDEISYINQEIIKEQEKLKLLENKEALKKANLKNLKINKINDTISNILNFFPEITDNKLKKDLAEDLVDNYWDELDFFDYMQMKGYKKIKGVEIEKCQS